jgi:UDP-N-acetylmuramate--alanine ligase
MDITKINHIHFTGIKGVGMTALALCALDLGIKVTGSDVEEEFLTDETLTKRGITWSTEFGVKNLEPKPDLVVTTGAHGGLNNPEVQAARELNIPVMSHAEALGLFAQDKKVIAVAGVDGKTTTSAMIATVLDNAGLNPSFAIGVSDIPSLGTPGRYNKEGEYFVIEADEYAISAGIDNRPRFTFLNPNVLVITNIRHDHPDIFPTLEDIQKVFDEFSKRTQSTEGKVISQSTNILPNDFKLNIPGEFNLLNASNAYLACKEIGLEESTILEGLKKYIGSKRRFEKIYEVNNITIYDDYAHNPDEIKASLKGAREWFPDRRILVYFQPHTYSRTKALFDDFAKSFNDADFVGIADIFSSAREEKDPTVTSEMLVEEVKKYHPNPENVGYSPDWHTGAEQLAKDLKPGDVLLTIGAGDIYKAGKMIAERLSSQT